MRKQVWAVITATFLAQPLSCLAGGLETRFTIVTVKDVPIGHWCRVQLSDAERYSVSNSSDHALGVELAVSTPFKMQEKKRPIPPIPDTAWVTISPQSLTLEPGAAGEADVRISVPDNPEHVGKQYEFWLLAKATGGQVSAGLITKVRFNVVAKPEAGKTGAGRESEGAKPDSSQKGH